LRSQHARFAQPIIAWLEFVVFLESSDIASGKSLVFGRPESTLVQEGGDFLMRVMVQQPIDFRDDIRTCHPALPGSLRWWQDHSLAGSSAETQVQRDLLTTKQSDILQQQSNHPFAFAVGGVPIAPKPRKVGGQLKNRRPLFLIEDLAIFFAAALVLLLRFRERSQLVIPVRFQRIGY